MIILYVMNVEVKMNKWETIIKDKDETIQRLQKELKEQSDFIFKLMQVIDEYKSKNHDKIIEDEIYLPYDTKVCPRCGGKIKHPYTGEVTSEQIDEDINTCLLMEVIDENDNTLGYEAICKHE